MESCRDRMHEIIVTVLRDCHLESDDLMRSIECPEVRSPLVPIHVMCSDHLGTVYDSMQ